MNKVNLFMSSVALALFFVGTAAADTLELKDGRVLKGKYLGGTQAVMRFELNGEVQTFNTLDIVALTFTGNFGHSAAAPAPAPAAAPVPSMGNSAYGGRSSSTSVHVHLHLSLHGPCCSENSIEAGFQTTHRTRLHVSGCHGARRENRC